MFHAALAVVLEALTPLLATWPRRFAVTAVALVAIWGLAMMTR